MKKLFALLLVLTMALSAFSAASAQEPVTITFWHTYGDAETPVIDEVIIPMFEAANPDIKVEAVRQSGDFNQMLVTALGTGRGAGCGARGHYQNQRLRKAGRHRGHG